MLSKQLRMYRETLGLTQLEMAKKLNISRQAYSHYENGDNEPNIEILKKLCIIFNCSADDLLDIQNKK